MSTHIQHETPPGHAPDDYPPAARDAESGSRAWRRVVHTQRTASPDHSDFYALAGEVVDTLRSLDSLTGLLIGQTAHYPATAIDAGGRLYDDENANPAHRIRSAVLALAETRQALATAERATNRFWSVISHLGIAHDAHDTDDMSGGGASR